MFGFDPAHTPQLELSLKGNYSKTIPAQRYIAVPNAFAWVDTNGDGLGDSWAISGGTPSIVTGNGFAGRAQRLVPGAAIRSLRSTNIVVKGAYYRIRFKWRAGINLQVRLGSSALLSLGANTGNAVFYDTILSAGSTSSILFQAQAGDFMEVSEIELWEISTARILDEGRSRNLHGFLYSGKAFQFDGLSAYIDCSNAVPLQITAALSICFWIKSATNGSVLVSKDDGGTNRAFQLFKDTNGRINFSTVSGTTVSTLVETTAGIDDEIWHRVVCTYDGTAKSIYIDGSLRDTAALSGAINNAPVNLFIGKLGNNSAYLSGAVSDVQLWSKALNAADVLFDFQYPEKPAWQRTGTSLSKSDLKGHWWLCENYGYYAFDYSGNGNDAALFGLTAVIQQKDIPQPALLPYSQKVFCTLDTIVRAGDTTQLRSIWNNGGRLTLRIMPYSDGEADLGTIITKGSWTLRCEGENAGYVKLRFIVLFSAGTGEWATTNTEVPLKQLSTISVEYNSASTANTPVIQVNGITVALTAASAPAGTYTTDTGSALNLGDNAASTLAFEGLIDTVRMYNTNVLKGSWNNEGVYRWSDLTGNNNLMVSSSNNKEFFLLQPSLYSETDILGMPLTNRVTRHGLNFDLKTYSESSFAPGIDFNASTADFSVSLWIRFARLANGASNVLLSMQDTATSGFCLFLDNTFHVQASLNALKSSASSMINDLDWHFIVCTVDRDDKMKIYVDNTEVPYSIQDNLASAAMSTTANLRLGTRSYGLGSQFKGQLAGVTLHRKILNAEEQKHLYGFGKEQYAF